MSTESELLRLARHLRGITQKKAAKNLGIAQAVLSRLENGIIEADAHVFKKASRVYDLPRSFFEIRDRVYGPPVSVHPMTRSKSDVTARELDMVTAELNIRLFHMKRFLENVDYNHSLDIPSLDIEQYDSPEQVAQILRNHWRLPRGPVKNLVELMERAGIIIGTSDFSGASISGITFKAPGNPIIVLVNQTHSADRIRFTLSHELGHMVMHKFPTPLMEKEANKFASAFLMPEQDIRPSFMGRHITLELLASLKLEWKVAMQALLYRANTLRFLTPNQNRYLWQQISARGWRLKEPAELDFPHEEPKVLKEIIHAHRTDLGFSEEEILELAKLYEKDFVRFYGPLRENSPQKPRLRIVV